MAAEWSNVLKDLDAGKVAPVFFLCGEPYPLERVLQAIKNAVLAGKETAFNFDALSATSAGPEAVLGAARTVPMLGPQRLVLVREAHLYNADQLKAFLPYIKDPSPSTCLVFVAAKADLRLKFFSQLKKSGVLLRFDPLKERQVPGWLTEEARRQKVKLRPGAAEGIAEAVGTDMGQLASALERLALYVGLGKPVGPAEVDELLAQTRQRSIFELTNAVGRGQRREALAILGKMLRDREPGVRIVAMLARHLRQLWLAKELSGRGLAKNELASALGVHPFFLSDIVGQAGRFGRGALEKMHDALFRADRSLKSSRLPDSVILERLVLSLCPAGR